MQHTFLAGNFGGAKEKGGTEIPPSKSHIPITFGTRSVPGGSAASRLRCYRCRMASLYRS
jgi:hypothetical protein